MKSALPAFLLLTLGSVAGIQLYNLNSFIMNATVGVGSFKNTNFEMLLHAPESVTLTAQWNESCVAVYFLSQPLTNLDANASLAYESFPGCAPEEFDKTHITTKNGITTFEGIDEPLTVFFQPIMVNILSTSSTSSTEAYSSEFNFTTTSSSSNSSTSTDKR